MNQDAKLPIDKKWSYLKNNLLNGPFTDQELISAFTENKIESQDLILNTVDQKWYSVEELPFLKVSPPLSVAPSVDSHQAQADIAYQEFNHFVNHQSFSLNNENSSTATPHVAANPSASNSQVMASVQSTPKENHIESHMSDDEVRRHNELLKSQPQIVVPPSSEMKTKPSIAFSGINIDLADSSSLQQSAHSRAEKLSFKDKFESRKKTVIFSAIAILVLILIVSLNLKKENQQSDLESSNMIDEELAGAHSKPIKKAKNDTAAAAEQAAATNRDSAQSGADPTLKNTVAAEVKTEDPALVAERKAKYMVYLDRHKKLIDDIKTQVEILNVRFSNNVKQKIRVSKYWDKYYTEWLDVSNRIQAEIDLSVAESKDDADLSLVLTKFTNLYNSVKTYTDLLNSNLRQFFSSQKLSEEKSIQMDAFKEKINSQVNEVELKIKDLEKKESE